jgi:hypothetical protein
MLDNIASVRQLVYRSEFEYRNLSTSYHRTGRITGGQGTKRSDLFRAAVHLQTKEKEKAMRFGNQPTTNRPPSPLPVQTALRLRREKYPALVVLLALTFLFSCSSTSRMAGPLTSFSAAVGDATVAAKSGIDTLQNADLDKSAYQASKAKELGEDLFTPFLTTGDVRQRLLVLDGLSMYATKMKQLSGLDRTADINKNFGDLNTNLGNLSKDISKIPDVKNPIPDGVLTAMVQIGQALVNLQVAEIRDKAITAALEKTDPYIGQACELIASEYSGPHGVLYDQLQHSYRTLETSDSEVFKSSKDSQARLKAAKDYGLLLKKKEVGVSLLNSIAESYRKIAKAHNALLLESKTGIKSDDALANLNSQIDYTKFLYTQLTK